MTKKIDLEKKIQVAAYLCWGNINTDRSDTIKNKKQEANT